MCVACWTLLAGCSDLKQQNVVVNDALPAVSDKDNDGCNNVSAIIESEEKKNGIPKGLLKAIADVESGCNPYYVNIRKRSLRFKSKDESMKFINDMLKKKRFNLSIGCLQLHYKSHKNHFSSVESMLSPKENIAYAAKIIKNLYLKYGNWKEATKRYHASNPKYNSSYYRKVVKKYGREI
ncbi:MAG: transglycosylase SLT domain-containing protein [Holosporales bacterium]|jgi:soluble lytic murein transglycosylase-like protein|nr:transglycosylase SLT domain-containing protein [Holosporales bacterium]